MKETFEHFMHIYFIVYTIVLALHTLNFLFNYKEYTKLSFMDMYMKPKGSNTIFWFALWILSMYY